MGKKMGKKKGSCMREREDRAPRHKFPLPPPQKVLSTYAA